MHPRRRLLPDLAHLKACITEGRRTGALHVLVVSLVVILALLIGYVQHALGSSFFADERWNADLDWSYLEMLGYVFVLVASAMLLALFLRRGAPVYAGWATGLVILLMDDAMELHERAGWWLERNSEGLDLSLHWVADLGELAFWAGSGAAVSMVIYATHRRSFPSAQAHSCRLAAMVALLMVFAVGVDMLNIAVKGSLDSGKVSFLLNFIETAGEAGAMAGLVAYAVRVTRHPVDEPL